MATGLNQQLWASADILRGKMDASEYKNYLLAQRTHNPLKSI